MRRVCSCVMNPATTTPQLQESKNANHDKKSHSDRARVSHVKGTERLVVDIHDYRPTRVARPAIGQSNNGIEFLQCIYHRDRDVEQDNRTKQWNSYPKEYRMWLCAINPCRFV